MKEDFVCQAIKLFGDGFIPLHRPVFEGNERQYLVDCIDSNFVSSVGEKVTEFENLIAEFTGAKYAVATVNGTAALHLALELSGVERGEEVISQALTFIATCNAIKYVGAYPVFVDVDKDTMGMSPHALQRFLETHASERDGQCFNKITGRRIAACVPMHTFGFPCRIKEIADICNGDSFSLPNTSTNGINGSWLPTIDNTQTMTYTFSPDAGQCSSTANMTVTVNPQVTGTETYTGCQGDGYSVVVNGVTYDEGNPSGTEVLTNSNSCDSTVTIDLIFNSTLSGA